MDINSTSSNHDPKLMEVYNRVIHDPFNAKGKSHKKLYIILIIGFVIFVALYALIWLKAV